LKVFALIKFVSVHLETVLNESIHVRDRLKLEVNVRLLLANLLESKHDAAERVDVLDFLVDLQTNLFDIIGKVTEQVLGLLVDVLREDKLPLSKVVLKSILHTFGLQGKSADLVSLLNLLDLSVLVVEVLELVLKVVHVRAGVAEHLKLILRLASP
jgi:hypothetical protein